MKQSIKFVAVVVLMISVYSCFNDSSVTPVDYSNYTQEREDSIISMYLDTLISHGLNVDTTSAGVYYVMLKEGEGNYPQQGDSVGVIYTGYFPENGYIFDKSATYFSDSIMWYNYRESGFISGFEDAVGHLNKGAKGLFLLPSSLAYGATGYNSIPPYSPLVFELKLADIYEQ